MPRSGRPKTVLLLTSEERSLLERTSQGRRFGRAAALRAKVVLACSEGRSNREVARQFDLAEHTIGKWRRRFVAARLEGLRDRRGLVAKRRGTVLQAGQAARVFELALALSQQAAFGPWSLGQAFGSQQLSTAAFPQAWAQAN